MASTSGTTDVRFCDAASISFRPPPSTSTDSSSDASLLDPQLHVADARTAAALADAARTLNQGDVVAFPTETVYGLAANALSSSAVGRIYAAKNRPADNPLIVHVSSIAMLRSLLPPGWEMPPSYSALIRAFWPGPLTLLFPANRDLVPDIVTAGHPTVAVRMPAHPVARALIASSGLPLAAPSANTSGRPSPTTAIHVLKDMEGRIPIILDGGSCDVGVESTVVDGLEKGEALAAQQRRPANGFSTPASSGVRGGRSAPLTVLRPGGVTVEDLSRTLLTVSYDLLPRVSSSPDGSPSASCAQRPDVRVHVSGSDLSLEAAPTTPGMKYRHYSPDAKVLLCVPAEYRARDRKHPPEPCPTVGEVLFAQCAPLREAFPDKRRFKVGVMSHDDSPFMDALVRLGLSPGGREREHRKGAGEGSWRWRRNGKGKGKERQDENAVGAMESEDSVPFELELELEGPSTPTAVAPHANGFPQPYTIITLHRFSLGPLSSPSVAARHLFRGLRELDEEVGVDLIIVEGLEEVREGRAVMNRLEKAAGEVVVVTTADGDE